MTTLMDQREAAYKAAADLVEKVKAGDAEAIQAAEEKMAEVKAIDEKIAAASDAEQRLKSIGGMRRDSKPLDDQKGDAPAKSLGDHFVKSLKAAGVSLKTPGSFSAPLFKAATDTHAEGSAYGPLLTDVDRNFVLPARDRLVVADLFAAGNVSGNAITYPVFGALEGGTGMVAEGAEKPQLHVADPTWRTDALSEVAGWFKITDDMAEDLDYVVSEINSTAIYDLQSKEEAQLLNGNGASPNLQGLLNRSGIQTLAQGADTVADAIFKAMTLVSTGSGFAADAIVINPVDYEKLRLGKDSNGQYFGGGYFTGQYGNGGLLNALAIWGLRTVVTSAIAANTVAVGAYSTAKVLRKGGLRVESTNSHEDDFTNDKITIRVRERLGLQVKYPAAFVKLTLTAA